MITLQGARYCLYKVHWGILYSWNIQILFCLLFSFSFSVFFFIPLFLNLFYSVSLLHHSPHTHPPFPTFLIWCKQSNDAKVLVPLHSNMSWSSYFSNVGDGIETLWCYNVSWNTDVSVQSFLQMHDKYYFLFKPMSLFCFNIHGKFYPFSNILSSGLEIPPFSLTIAQYIVSCQFLCFWLSWKAIRYCY